MSIEGDGCITGHETSFGGFGGFVAEGGGVAKSAGRLEWAPIMQ